MPKRRPATPLALALAMSAAAASRPKSIRWAVPVRESATTVDTAPTDPRAEAADSEATDRNRLKKYWTKNPDGLAKWAKSRHPWTALYRQLRKHMPDDMAKRTASQWYHDVFGHWPGTKRDNNADDGEPMTDRVTVREATTGGATTTPGGRLLVRLIRAGWSLNGNLYPPEVLRAAADNGAFPKGTLTFADHDTDEEESARPAGSVKNLAGVLETDARWDEGEQALMAEVRLFAPWRESILDMASAIGMSIRAWVTGEQGERDGRSGFLVDNIVEGRSVDFVTVPAAGGGIVSVLEAVGHPVREAPNVGHWLESRIHASFTNLADQRFGDGYLTRDERITLSSAIGDALTAFAARVETDAPHLYQRHPWSEPDEAPHGDDDDMGTKPHGDDMGDEPADEATTTVGGDQPPTTTETAGEEPAMSGTQTGSPPVQAGTATVPDGATTAETTQVDPAAQALAAVTEQLAAMREQLAAVAARADARDAENQRLRNEHTAQQAITAAVNSPDVPAGWRAQITPRVTATVLAAVPTGESGDVDTAALGTAVRAAVEAEVGYCRAVQAQALEEAGVGVPTGLGAAEARPDDGLEGELRALFEGSLGLSGAALDIAVKGR